MPKAAEITQGLAYALQGLRAHDAFLVCLFLGTYEQTWAHFR